MPRATTAKGQKAPIVSDTEAVRSVSVLEGSVKSIAFKIVNYFIALSPQPLSFYYIIISRSHQYHHHKEYTQSPPALCRLFSE
jgi:hypothetical protein